MIKFFKELLTYLVANIVLTALLFTISCIIMDSPPWVIDNDEPYEFWIVLIALVVIYSITSLIVFLIYKFLLSRLITNNTKSFLYSAILAGELYWILLYRKDVLPIEEEVGISVSMIILAIMSWFILQRITKPKSST